ncbi:MAG: DUF3822 family protein [Phycisphaerales bacterium]|nr:DUF3822 family protein [Phycisphaerales bacterium]
MSSDIINNILRRQYTAHKGYDLLSQVHRVICIVTPDGFVSAGFHPSGEILIVNSSQLQAAHWSPSFIEYEVLNDNLLAAPEMIKSIFVAAVKNVIIPEALYTDEATAFQWLQSIFHCEKDEQYSVCALGKSKVYNCYSYPQSIQDIFAKYTADVVIRPLNFIHFKNSNDVENLLQCTITDGYVLATLHYQKKLHWHQTFEFHNTEDILYKLTAACQYYGIDVHDFELSCTTTSIDQYTLLKKLQHFIPALQNKKTGISDIISPEWSPSIHLFQQLYLCE